MTKVIWKYPIHTRLEIPNSFIVRGVGIDGRRNPAMWIEVETNNIPDICTFTVTCTGDPIPEGDVQYLGHFVVDDFVGHVWWLK